jgi:2-methylcitrate dehydratase PrpD
LLRLDEQKMIWALGNAATQSSGLCECLGWPAKSISVGNAARNGMWAALLADKGFEGPPEPIAGVQGFFNAMNELPNWDAMTNGFGETWEITDNSLKPYPCGFVIHPALDCVLDWRREHPRANVERIVLRGHPLLADRTDRPDIATGREAQVSVQHAVAAALVFGCAGVDQFTDACARNPEVIKIRPKVEVVRDPAIATIAAEVDLYTSDGKMHALATKAARGSSSNPMSDEDVEAKLRTAATGRIGEKETQLLIEGVWALETSGDVAGLVALAVPGS